MTARQFFSIVEIRTKLVSVSTFSLAALYTLWRFGALRAAPAILCAAAALAVDMGTTAFNSYFDFRRSVDAAPTNREADKVLVHERLPAGQALAVALGCFAAAGALGLALAFVAGFWVILFGIVGLAVGFFYSGGPKPISRTPFGELFAGGFLGSMLFLVAVRAGSGAMDWKVLAASAPGALIVASILAANNLCDIEGDRAAGRRTLPIALGKARAEAFLYGCGSFAFMLTALFGLAGLYPAWSAAGAGVGALAALPSYRALARRGFSHRTKSATMRTMMRILLIWSACAAAGFVAAIAGA